MEKSKSVIRRLTEIDYKSIVIFCICITVSLLNIIIYFEVKNINNNSKLEEKIFTNTLNNLKNDSSIYNEKIVSLNNELNIINNIDISIKEMKTKYFVNAKEVENRVLDGRINKRIAYLTFDDGPYSSNNMTMSYLDVLESKNVLATFFVLGKKGSDTAPIYERQYHSGHTLANHTYGHGLKRGLYSSVNSFINDVKKLENFLSNMFDGYKTNIVRFPGGSTTAGRLKNGIIKELNKMNYGWVNWDLETGDGNGKDKNNVTTSVNNVINNLGDKKVVVILMHDYSRTTIKSLPLIIDKLREKDYIFLPLFYESVKVSK